jgi:hypothetical protein
MLKMFYGRKMRKIKHEGHKGLHKVNIILLCDPLCFLCVLCVTKNKKLHRDHRVSTRLPLIDHRVATDPQRNFETVEIAKQQSCEIFVESELIITLKVQSTGIFKPGNCKYCGALHLNEEHEPL